MAPSPPLSRIAIVGATGRVGGAFASALLKTGLHTLTALRRAGSSGTLPSGIAVADVDYDDEASLVSALRGQHFFIITLGVRAPGDLHDKLVAAAGKAGVPWIMPNAYGGDIQHPTLQTESLTDTRPRYESVNAAGASYVVLVCGFWYEWSLSTGEPWFGFDIAKRSVVFFDDGRTPINSSTWDQCGRAIAALLSLPESGASPCVEDWRNAPLYVDSFTVSQRDMLDSLHRVLGTTDADWSISYEPSAERYKKGLEDMQNGVMLGFARAMYSRVFFPGGGGNYGATYPLQNETLGLPKESLDEATKRAVDMVEGGWSYEKFFNS